MSKENQKNNDKWEKMGFAGLILSALNNAGKKKNKKKKEIIKKEYW